MSSQHVYGSIVARAPDARPLRELRLTFVPLDFVSEWRRGSETADYFARFFAFDFQPRDVAATIISTVINELVENAVKFSAEKTAPAELVVSQYDDAVTFRTINAVSADTAAIFGETINRIVAGEPEA